MPHAKDIVALLLLFAGIGCKHPVAARELAAASSSSIAAASSEPPPPSDADFDKQLEAPKLEVKDDRVVLDAKDFSCSTTTMREITLLDNQLAKNAALWKMRHTGGRFEDVELPTVLVDDRMGVVPVASVLMTVADAGYPRMRVVAGGRTLTIRWHTRAPSTPDTLEVTQQSTSGFRLALRSERATVATADAIGPALAKSCPPSGPCAQLVVFAFPPAASFGSIAPVLRATLESDAFKSGAPAVDFSLAGHPVTQPTESTWGRE
jgi:hypothetical protein